MKGFDWSRVWRKDVPWYKNFYLTEVRVPGFWFLVWVLFMAWAYASDVSEYQAVYVDPCSYCVLVSVQDLGDGEKIYSCNDLLVGGSDWMMNGSNVSFFDS